jgi:hypothetical protein
LKRKTTNHSKPQIEEKNHKSQQKPQKPKQLKKPDLCEEEKIERKIEKIKEIKRKKMESTQHSQIQQCRVEPMTDLHTHKEIKETRCRNIYFKNQKKETKKKKMQSLDKFQFYEMNDYSVPMRNLPKKKR